MRMQFMMLSVYSILDGAFGTRRNFYNFLVIAGLLGWAVTATVLGIVKC